MFDYEDYNKDHSVKKAFLVAVCVNAAIITLLIVLLLLVIPTASN